MSKAAAETGLGPTVVVAIEQSFPPGKRGVQDELSYRILPLAMRGFVSLMRFASLRNWMIRASERDLPGVWGGMICRKRYIDDILTNAAGQMGAVVNLGAGFDTRIFRLPSLADTPWFEADQEEIIRKKQARLVKVFGSLPPRLNLVPLDFDTQDPGQALAACGYTTATPAFYIMEAVTQYLTEAGIEAAFDLLAKAAIGSRLVLTYVRRDFLEGRALYGWEKAYRKFVVKDRVWLFGMDPEEWPGFLKPCGWQLAEDVSYAELAGKYVKPLGRDLASTLVERILLAEKR